VGAVRVRSESHPIRHRVDTRDGLDDMDNLGCFDGGSIPLLVILGRARRHIDHEPVVP